MIKTLPAFMALKARRPKDKHAPSMAAATP